MKIAVPTANGLLAMHFGHCEQFTIIDTDDASKEITAVNQETPPPHEPGVLPRWLHELGVDLIIAGGMGMRAQQLFDMNGIKVVVGAPSDEPQKIVSDYINGILETGDNVCDH